MANTSGYPDEVVARKIAEARLENFAQAQAILSELGTMAIPPAGHSCPDCNRSGAAYCPTIAAERLRGIRK